MQRGLFIADIDTLPFVDLTKTAELYPFCMPILSGSLEILTWQSEIVPSYYEFRMKLINYLFAKHN